MSDITDNSGAVLSALARAKLRALEIIGGKAEGYAKQLCPVDTGRLRNSITHAVDGDTAVVGSNVEYAPSSALHLKTHTVPSVQFIFTQLLSSQL